MALRIPMVLCKAPVAGFGGAMDGLPVWVDEKRHIKKQRDGQALALGGHRSMPITNNQRDKREVCGNSDIIILGIELSNQKRMKMKYTVALDGRVLMNFHTTTNQK